MEEGKKSKKTLSASFVTGAVALVFLIIGYEVAVFVHLVFRHEVVHCLVIIVAAGGEDGCYYGQGQRSED